MAAAYAGGPWDVPGAQSVQCLGLWVWGGSLEFKSLWVSMRNLKTVWGFQASMNDA